MKRLFISTTNTIDNGKALEYFGVVSSHIVAGTDYFTDLAASFTDIFGGRSFLYRRELERLYDDALDELSNKAQLLGANSILGLKIDMDNISGKGMSMFMITAVGTAAKIQFDKEVEENDTSNSISSVILVNEIAKRALLQRLMDEKTIVMERDWEPILKYPDNDYVLPLTRKYFQIVTQPNESDYRDKFKKNLGQLISMVDREIVVQGIYEGIRLEKGFDPARLLIKEHSLFDAKSILALVHEGFTKRAISILSVEKPSYTEMDLHDMEELLDTLEHLPDVGRIEVVQDVLFRKDVEKFICAHGHKTNSDVEFCSSCGENIKGITRDEVDNISRFKNRVSVLKDLMTALSKKDSMFETS